MRTFCGAVFALMVGLGLGSVRADDLRETVQQASAIFAAKQSSARPIPGWVLQQARGIGIIEVTKGAFGVGGADGDGVIIARTPDGWSAPFAFTQGGGSVGFQIGVDIQKYIYVFNTEFAWRAFVGREHVRFQAGAQATAGPDSATRDAAKGLPTSDLFVYTLSDGAFAGAAIGGQVVGSAEETNHDAYGTNDPAAILGGRVPSPPYAASFTQLIDRAAGLHAAMRPSEDAAAPAPNP
jgi:SH3 domain-containing YSC84-like protein 1